MTILNTTQQSCERDSQSAIFATSAGLTFTSARRSDEVEVDLKYPYSIADYPYLIEKTNAAFPKSSGGDRYLLAKRYVSPEPAFMSGSSGGR